MLKERKGEGCGRLGVFEADDKASKGCRGQSMGVLL